MGKTARKIVEATIETMSMKIELYGHCRRFFNSLQKKKERFESVEYLSRP